MERKSVSKIQTKGVFQCKHCQALFNTLYKLKYHKLRSHGKWKDSLKCSTCDKTYNSLSNLRRHQRSEHQDQVEGGSSSSWTCSQCGHKSQDQFHHKIHLRKHTGERPYICPQCQFGFYKNSDLKRHLENCQGIKYRCGKCQEVFHFKRQCSEHLMWSKTCGTMKDQLAPNEENHPEISNSRYMSDKPSVVRVNFSKSQAVVGVNCESLIDQTIFAKRKKKSRCGICKECEKSVDCGKCDPCVKNGQNGKKICIERRCSNLVDQYDVIKGKERLLEQSEFHQRILQAQDSDNLTH